MTCERLPHRADDKALLRRHGVVYTRMYNSMATQGDVGLCMIGSGQGSPCIENTSSCELWRGGSWFNRPRQGAAVYRCRVWVDGYPGQKCLGRWISAEPAINPAPHEPRVLQRGGSEAYSS